MHYFQFLRGQLHTYGHSCIVILILIVIEIEVYQDEDKDEGHVLTGTVLVQLIIQTGKVVRIPCVRETQGGIRLQILPLPGML